MLSDFKISTCNHTEVVNKYTNIKRMNIQVLRITYFSFLFKLKLVLMFFLIVLILLILISFKVTKERVIKFAY